MHRQLLDRQTTPLEYPYLSLGSMNVVSWHHHTVGGDSSVTLRTMLHRVRELPYLHKAHNAKRRDPACDRSRYTMQYNARYITLLARDRACMHPTNPVRVLFGKVNTKRKGAKTYLVDSSGL